MDYCKLSDAEINYKVAKSFPDKFFFNEDGNPYELVPDPMATYSGSDYDEVEFNPCNNPADAWPIIVENGIGFHKQLNGLWCVTNRLGKYPQYSVEPLRAAMIVYLMMNEVSDESECILRKNTKHNA